MFSKEGDFPKWWPIKVPSDQIKKNFPKWWPTEKRLHGDTKNLGLWRNIEFDLDDKNFIAKQYPGVIAKKIEDQNGIHYMLKNSITRSYHPLSQEDFWIWERLDGKTTVKQLASAYRLEISNNKDFKAKPFPDFWVITLLESLRNSHMLSESPPVLYTELSKVIEERKPFYKLSLLARTVFTRKFTIKNLNSRLEYIYKNFGRHFFSIPIQIILLLVSLIGTYFFIQFLQDPKYQILQPGSYIQLGLLAYIPVIIHEFGHAITAKHVGCEVHQGGVMFYYGLPAAFVDTTDALMVGKREKLAITWAGPYTGYIIVGICSLLVHFLPNFFLPKAAITVQVLEIALTAFTVSTFNLLPLLKLDGYHLLADGLNIDRLRERSMKFVTHHLPLKIKTGRLWTDQEKIFLGYGILSFLSTFYFAWAGLRYWDSQVGRSFSILLKHQGDIWTLTGSAWIVILAISSLGYLFVLFSNQANSIIRWLEERGFLSTRERTTIVIIICIAIITLISSALQSKNLILGIIGLTVFSLSIWMVVDNFISMRASMYRWIWVITLLVLLVGLSNFISIIKFPVPATLNFKLSHFHLLAILFMNLVLVLMGRLTRDLMGSWREFSLFLIALGIALYLALYSSGFANNINLVLAIGLVFGGLIHWKTRPRVKLEIQKLEPTTGTREKILFAYDWITKVLLDELELDFGFLTRSTLEVKIHTKKKGAGPMEDLVAKTTLFEIAHNLTINLTKLLVGMEKVAGRLYTRRTLAYGYDTLNWDLQESAEDYILKYVPQAYGLSDELSTVHSINSIETLESNKAVTMLKKIPGFDQLNDNELMRTVKGLTSFEFKKGNVILKEGEKGDYFYIVESGEVVVKIGSTTCAKLEAGEYFGEIGLFSESLRTATVTATQPTVLLRLQSRDFRRLLKSSIPFKQRIERTSSRRIKLNIDIVGPK